MGILIILAIIIAFIIISNLRSSIKHRFKPHKTPTRSIDIETIVITCSNKDCQQRLRIPKSNRKLTITCPTCNKSFSYSPRDVAENANIKDTEYETIKTETATPKYIKIIKSVSDSFSDIPEGQRISISKIKDSRCPFKYYKNYIEKPKEEKPSLTIELGLGHFFHGKVEQLFKTIALQRREIRNEDVLRVSDIVNEFEISFLWNRRLREPYKIIGSYDFDHFKDRLTNIIKNFNRYVIPKLYTHNIIRTEGNLQIRTNDFVIRGKYDLITQDYNNKLTLWDWKTGKKPRPDYYEDFTLQKIQLGVYAIWVRYKYKTEHVLANVVFLRDNVDFLKEVFGYHLEEKVINFIDIQYKTLKSITNYIPMPNNLCPWCSWNSKCGYY